MKRLLIGFLIYAFSVSLVSAADIKTFDIDFRAVSLPDISNAVLKGMLNKNFVLSDDLLTDTRKVTVNIKQVSSDKVLPVFKHFLNDLDIDVVEKDDVIFVSHFKKDNKALVLAADNQPLVSSDNDAIKHKKDLIFSYYKPKNRSVLYLSKLAKFTGVNVAEVEETSNVLAFSSDSQESLDKTEILLKQFDTLQTAITIKAALLEYSTTNESSRSISGALSLISGKLGLVYAAGQKLSNAITYKSQTLTAALSAIEGDSNFHYLAQPTIRVLNGEKAKLIVGSEVPVRGQLTVDKNGNTVQSVEYKTSGVQFEVTPKIQDEIISLYINQQISNFGITTTSNIDSPTLFKRQAETTIDIKRGSLVMMAGLDETKDTASTSGLSFLPKFLYSKSKTNSNSQIILLLEVVDDTKI
jgi:general secretion pathway protein D